MNIKLDFQGRIFVVNYATLIKIPYFYNLFDGLLEDDAILNFTIPVNRSPEIFEHVLSLMINPFYDYPSEYIYNEELEYYGFVMNRNKQLPQ
jgi:hypothetical protein